MRVNGPFRTLGEWAARTGDIRRLQRLAPVGVGLVVRESETADRGIANGDGGPARKTTIIPSGKYRGVAVACIDSEDLRFLAGMFFNRDYEMRRAIFSEIKSREPRRRAAERTRVRK